MAIRFQCPRCSSIRTVHDRMNGKQIRCPDCDSVVRIPEITREEGLAAVVTLPNVGAPKVGASKIASPKNLQVTNLQAKAFATDGVESQSRPQSSGPTKRLKPSATASASDPDEEAETLGFPKPELPKDDMDMTPMVDVTFLLLIFFMITASFSTEKAIQQKAAMSNQASSQQKEEESDTVKILIDEFNAYTVIFPDGDEREATSKQELLAILSMAELDGASEDANSIAIEAHEDSIHATVVGALDAGREKGFSQFQVTVVENFD